MSDNKLLLQMDESHFLALEEEFFRMTADIVSLDDLPPLELDDEWFRILREEEERLRREGYDERSAPAGDNGEVSIATNCTPYTAMESPLTQLPSDFEEPGEMMIDAQEDEFDEEGGLPRDFEGHDEVLTGTDGDEFDADGEIITGTDGDECDDDEETITGAGGDEFHDERELPRDFRESEELTVEEEEELYRFYEEMRETYHGEFEISDPPEGSGVQWSPNQIEVFLQTLPGMDTGTLGPDDLKCAICQSEFGKERGEGETSDSGQGLPGQESAEHPVKLPCGHVFGLWCIETWLLNAQPASCPLCRYLFQPV